MRIAVLGPLEVLNGEGAPVRIPGAKERLLLALLAMHAGSVVSTDRIVETLWNGESPPPPRSRQDTRRRLRARRTRLRSGCGRERKAGRVTSAGGGA